MEMELHQVIHLLADNNRIIMSIRTWCPVHLDRMSIEMRNNIHEGLVVKLHGFARAVDEARECISIDVDGRLFESLVADHIVWVYNAPMAGSSPVCAVLLTPRDCECECE